MKGLGRRILFPSGLDQEVERRDELDRWRSAVLMVMEPLWLNTTEAQKGTEKESWMMDPTACPSYLPIPVDSQGQGSEISRC